LHVHWLPAQWTQPDRLASRRAHPNATATHELDALKFVGARFGKHQIYELLLDNLRRFAPRGGEWNSYAYEVFQQWQGRFDELRVIGDKKGGYSTLRLAENPDLLASSSKTTSTDARQTPTPKNGWEIPWCSTCARSRSWRALIAVCIGIETPSLLA
jgi:hypothetical protein